MVSTNDKARQGPPGDLDYQQWLIVVPARLASGRLPEKVILDLAGKPLIVRVAERMQPLVERGAQLIVATDAQKVADVCQQAGLKTMLIFWGWKIKTFAKPWRKPAKLCCNR